MVNIYDLIKYIRILIEYRFNTIKKIYTIFCIFTNKFMEIKFNISFLLYQLLYIELTHNSKV